MKTIDLNVDIGEGFPNDLALLEFATSANVCCGAHAGGPAEVRKTIDACIENRVRIGAHPGYPDRENFGRSPIPSGKQREYLDSIFSQIRTFVLHYHPKYVKPHGAFYNKLAVPLKPGWDSLSTHIGAKTPYEAGGQELGKVPGAGAMVIALRISKIGLMGMEGTIHQEIAKRADVPFIKEGFADRRYDEDGTLVPRSDENAILSDRGEMKDQILRLAESCDSICLHGDEVNSVSHAEFVTRVLTDAGILVAVPVEV